LSDLFISYASADREKARLIARVFEERGHSVWWDRTIPPGREFDEVIQEAIERAKCAIVLWSKTSVKSKWVKTEASEAEARDVLVPARIDETALPLEFKRIQTADLSSWEGKLDHPELLNVVASVEQLLRGEGPPPHALPARHTRRAVRSWLAPLLGALLVSVAGWFAYRYATSEKHEAKNVAASLNSTEKGSVGNPPVTLIERTRSEPALVEPATSPTASAQSERRGVQAGVSQTDSGKGHQRINLLARENGGQILVATSDSWAKMIDGDDTQWDYIHNGEGVFAFKDEKPATFDMFTVMIRETSDGNLNEFELLSGNDTPLGRFDSIGKFKTQNRKLFKTPFQEFAFPSVRAKYLKVRALSNHRGQPALIQGYEFELLGNFE
jgi:hypothetical protein